MGKKSVATGHEDEERGPAHVYGQYVLGDFRPSDLLDTAGALAWQAARQPGAVAKAARGFFGELRKIVAGTSDLEPEKNDRRFADPAWHEHRYFHACLQGHLALSDALSQYASSAGLNSKQTERAQFLMSQIGNAIAPTNFPWSNPIALQRARETHGKSFLHGARNLVSDLREKRLVPSQVDERPFRVGGNLGITPGAVVHRQEMFELLQYYPQTTQVRQRPILIVPSIVNKYYVFDLAPKRSLIEHFVQQGFTVFCMAWRNPTAEHDHWGMAAYQDSINDAVDAVRDICAVDSINLWAVCGAGPVVAPLLGHYQAIGERKVNSLMLFVSPLDLDAIREAPVIGAFADKRALPTVSRAIKGRRMSAKQFTLLFAMLRANDLIWNYWVNQYLMGEAPPAFDVMYWNADGTGMTAQYNKDFTEFVENNPLLHPGSCTVRGTPIPDLSTLDLDSYVLGAVNDHLCVWQGVYRSARLLGSRSRFVLGNSGHIQTIVCPPSNPKASYYTNNALPPTPEEWLKDAKKNVGSWWTNFAEWTTERAGDWIAARSQLGNERHPPIWAAPGTYVHERG